MQAFEDLASSIHTAWTRRRLRPIVFNYLYRQPKPQNRPAGFAPDFSERNSPRSRLNTALHLSARCNTVYKIDFHVAAESSMFFLFPRAFAFDFDFRCRRPVPRFHPHSRGAESSTPVHVEVPLPGGCCHLQSDLGETASPRWIGRFSAVTRTRLRLDSLTPALQFVLRSFGGEAIERLINLTGHPQARQQHRQLARHRHHSSPFAVLAAARSQLQSPSSQSTVGGQPTQYVMRCLHQ